MTEGIKVGPPGITVTQIAGALKVSDEDRSTGARTAHRRGPHPGQRPFVQQAELYTVKP